MLGGDRNTFVSEAAASSMPPGAGRSWMLAVVGGLLALGAVVWAVSSAGTEAPGDDSVAAGFARDMSAHHAQAVAMAEQIRDRTEDPALRLLARDIALTQQSQIGQMRGWLDIWDLPVTGSAPRMAWMDEPMSGPMPGMATTADVAALQTEPVSAAEVDFLRLMIAHHRGGVAMARAVLGRAVPDEVTDLARGIADSQQSEIEVLQQMLRGRGALPAATPVPDHSAMGE